MTEIDLLVALIDDRTRAVDYLLKTSGEINKMSDKLVKEAGMLVEWCTKAQASLAGMVEYDSWLNNP